MASRRNLSEEAKFEEKSVRHPFAEGGLRYVAKGVYTRGSRKGEVCVGKWFKEGFSSSADTFEDDVRATKKSIEIVDAFNSLSIVNKPIKFNDPEVFQFNSSGDCLFVEPYIKNYSKFNSNSVRYIRSHEE